MTRTTFTGARVFDGSTLYEGHALVVEEGLIAAILPEGEVPSGGRRIALEGGILMPGFVDLQANGGGGVMFNDETTVEGLRCMAEAHASTGTLTILPTLITDTAERTRAAIEAVARAVENGVPGIAGLHLEGPHLEVTRKGAHDAALIRPMTDADEVMLCAAAARLPTLKLTVAPEAVTSAQIARLTRSGALVSLGHTDCSYDAARGAFAAGARCVTHLFNAMSPLKHREPGLVGAALDSGGVHVGIIADGVHVHPAALRVAMAAKVGAGEMFLVTDAMATLASELREFRLNGRRVLRDNQRLTLEDGTLAGADLEMPRALRVAMTEGGVPEAKALAMATSIPARLLTGGAHRGALRVGAKAVAIHLPDRGRARPLAELTAPA